MGCKRKKRMDNIGYWVLLVGYPSLRVVDGRGETAVGGGGRG